ncbi:hypothetical protein DP939_01820 [Spongiactinospora rosea]|uniref:Activator of Hsp90 ATPase homologue 1/2-like C-terminal domain-containing protein n=1 Tax=Spongiactinospora rosea TaxID=2248750 RepID=A0A366M7A1_9ACTN|nr:SRPBCC family protein [Spongiactinospora rosea]RBQ21474.1 hypothetical protein DP939_01820 [Spongiactinospora rosea]
MRSADLGTLTTTADGRYQLRFERRLAHSPARVWRGITESGQLKSWFPMLVEFDLTPGAKVRFDMPDATIRRLGLAPGAPGTTGRGEMTQVDPPHLLEYTWDGEILRWELSPDGDGGCLLVFTNVFDDRDTAIPAASGWHAGLEVLAAVLDDRPVTWSAWDRADELTPAYTATVG